MRFFKSAKKKREGRTTNEQGEPENNGRVTPPAEQAVASQPAPTVVAEAQEQAATPEPDHLIVEATGPAVQMPVDPEAQIQTAKVGLHKLAKEYNETRNVLQSALFDRRTKLQTELGKTAADAEQAKETLTHVDSELAELRKSDDGTFDAEMAAIDKQLADNLDAINEHEQKLQQLTHDLSETQGRLTTNQQLQAGLREQEQKIGQTLRAEEDPMKLLALADEYRDRLQKLAADQKQAVDEADKETALATQLTDSQSQENQELNTVHQGREQLTASKQSLQQRIDEVAQKRATSLRQLEQQHTELTAQVADHEAHHQALGNQLTQVGDDIATWLGTGHQIVPLELTAGTEFVLSMDSFLPKDADTFALIVRRLLQAGCDHVGLYTGYFDIKMNHDVDEWCAQHDIPRNQIRVFNALAALQKSGPASGQPVRLPANAESLGWSADHLVQTVNLQDGNWQLAVTYQDESAATIVQIDYKKGDRLTKRSDFNEAGVLSANTLYNGDGKVKREEFYRQDGLMVMAMNYADGEQNQIEVFDSAGLLVNTFADIDAFNLWWLQDHFTDQTKLVGRLNDTNYLNLVQHAHLAAVPYVSLAHTHAEPFAATVAKLDTPFIVADHQVADAVAKAVKADTQMLLLNSDYLPLTLATPAVMD